MVVASVSTDTERFELKTVVGGFIELKQMSHGQMLQRREMSTQQAMRGLGGKGEDAELAISLAQRKAQEYEFKHCITDHNLEYVVEKPGQDNVHKPFDFKKPEALDLLAPKVGAEIETLIESINNFDDGEADGSGN